MTDNRGRKGQQSCGNCGEYIPAALTTYYRRGACKLRKDRGRHNAVHHRTAACPEWRKRENINGR